MKTQKKQPLSCTESPIHPVHRAPGVVRARHSEPQASMAWIAPARLALLGVIGVLVFLLGTPAPVLWLLFRSWTGHSAHVVDSFSAAHAGPTLLVCGGCMDGGRAMFWTDLWYFPSSGLLLLPSCGYSTQQVEPSRPPLGMSDGSSPASTTRPWILLAWRARRSVRITAKARAARSAFQSKETKTTCPLCMRVPVFLCSDFEGTDELFSRCELV